MAVFVEEERCRDEDGYGRLVLCPKYAVETGNRTAAFSHLAKHFIRARLAAVDARNVLPDDLVCAIAEQCLGTLVEQYDMADFVGRDDRVG